MIPKIIHFCWLSGDEMSAKVKETLNSWILKLWKNNYKIMIWDASTIYKFMYSSFFRYMYEHRKWSFCSDYIRCKVLYEYGGIYLDSDVDVVDSFDRILHLDTFFGLECVEYNLNNEEYINKYKINNRSFEAGIIGSYPNNELFIKVLNKLNNIDISKYGNEYIITDLFVDTIKTNNYLYKVVNSIKEAEECELQNILPIFNAPRFDRWYDGTDEQDYGICDHHFYNSWIK